MRLASFLLGVALLAPGAAPTTPPPIPTYDGCAQGDRVRIVTGLKRLLDRAQRPLDLGPHDGKRLRFRGYLLDEATLVMLDERPTVVGPCRAAPTLPAGAGGTRITRAAVVRALEVPLHSGELEGRQLLSGRFRLIQALAGVWPAEFRLTYQASVEANERAVLQGEPVLLVPIEGRREGELAADSLLPVSPADLLRVLWVPRQEASQQEAAEPGGERHCLVVTVVDPTPARLLELAGRLELDGAETDLEGETLTIWLDAQGLRRLFGGRYRERLIEASASAGKVRSTYAEGVRVPARYRGWIEAIQVGHQICE